MKKSLSSAVGILALFAVGVENTHAQVQSAQPLDQLKVGFYYALTPQMAKVLNIDLRNLRQNLALEETDKILFKLKDDGALDLSIYEDATFGAMRADGVIE
ncbi:MAG: hypothetical protein AB7O96_03520 [Pseudobdellovibrionaceae bacterium]